MSKFFEPINASATHIYHSALELCPISSIVRTLYYDRCHGITRLPRVVIGTPNSWDSTISISGEGTYKFCAWSPCGRFVAAQTGTTVEIRNQLTFELLMVLKPTKNAPLPTGPLAYSPDGRSLASGFSNTIVIWDVQTGGVAKEIGCRRAIVSMAWSSDGRTIATTLRHKEKPARVETYEVASGAQLFTKKLESGIAFWHLWAHEKSFRLMTIPLHSIEDPTLEITISEIGPILIKIESFSVATGMGTQSISNITFSPSTYRVSISGPGTLCVMDIRSSICLLKEGGFTYPQFSSDGSFFAALGPHTATAWRYTSGCYTKWGGSLFQRDIHMPDYKITLHFSPTSSSILAQRRKFLQLRRLDNPPTTSRTDHLCAAISRSGGRIATAHRGERTVTIIDIHSRAPSKFIDAGIEIKGLVITGNVLMVASQETVVAWLLREEGTVEGVFDDKRADRSDSIWTTTPLRQPYHLISFNVEGQVGVIQGKIPFIYNIETGDILDRAHEPQRERRRWDTFYGQSDGLQYHRLSRLKAPPEDGWPTPGTKMQVGWVTDPGGRHRFWLPVEWRKSLSPRNWHHDITTLFGRAESQLIIIKF